jgi:hypothetical protein
MWLEGVRNINMNLKVAGYETVDWIHQAHDRNH